MSNIDFISSIVSGILNDPLRLSIFVLTALVVIILLLYALSRALSSGEKLKYEFVTIIAHKFRTPLSQTKWALDDLISSEQDSYKKQSLSQIYKSNENLIRLTTTLIETADSDAGAKALYHFEPVNLCDTVRECGAILKRDFHEKNLFFSVECSGGDNSETVYARADRNRLEFVLQTVMENACRYSPPGRNVRVLVYRKGHKAIISVTDDGIGMDRGDLARLFTKFFRSKRARTMDTDGLGVSLYLAKSVMRRHHGNIEARSEGIDKGTTFIISLPRAKSPRTEKPPK